MFYYFKCLKSKRVGTMKESSNIYLSFVFTFFFIHICMYIHGYMLVYVYTYICTYSNTLYWRSRDELISDVLLWTPSYGRAKAGRPARTYIQQLCEDTRCSPEELPEAMNDREKWRERVRDIRASGTTWWWWYIHLYIPVNLCVWNVCICAYMHIYICAYMHIYIYIYIYKNN